ncbi:plasma-membrane choline transporter-domain-containing protein [Thamnocephalis sphaerospora]|uniref:Protein PNS1 n=1 Tax=Thamnocephalis sphaerospora TaxID=78915 RepID=A0A4P9XWH4_9FUNG|nr:plasma-membrane choline transporter-domain-containing protein [Thamnocephalis sphaerospora]|eukprot:RKP10677.1 plasma-membrane choline transporter-domain-containing protein [Thamnocephalis sphaerospora]
MMDPDAEHGDGTRTVAAAQRVALLSSQPTEYFDAPSVFYSVQDIASFSDTSPHGTPSADIPLGTASFQSEGPPSASDIYAEDRPDADILTESHSMTDRLIPKALAHEARSSTAGPPTSPAGQPRVHRDRPFAVLYMVSLAVFFISGLAMLFTTDSSTLGSLLPRSLYAALKNSLGYVGMLLVILCAIGATWLFLLRRYVRILVRVNILLVPVIAMAIFTWAMIEAFASPVLVNQTPSGGMIAASITALLTAGGYSYYMRKRWSRLQDSINIIELSLDVLKANPDLLAVGAFLTAVYIAFAALWLVFFNRVMLLGGVVPSPRGEPATWVPDSGAGWLAFFYVSFFFWTANVLNDVQRIATANVVSQWYFNREASGSMVGKSAAPALGVAAGQQLGTAAFSASIITVTRLIRTVTFIASRLFFIRAGVIVVQGMQRWLIRSLASVSGFTPAYAGITGLGFLDSTREVTRMFRRNLVHRFDTDRTVRVVLTLTSVGLAAISGLSVYTYAAQTLHTPHAALVATIGGSVQFFVSRFYTRVMTAISDAIFLCWTIDRDQNVNRCPAAHQAFAQAETA